MGEKKKKKKEWNQIRLLYFRFAQLIEKVIWTI